MMIALGLLAYAAANAVLMPRLLIGARWTCRSPGLAIAAWRMLTLTVLLALVLAGLSLSVASPPIEHRIADLLHACAVALSEQYTSSGGALAGAIGLLIAAVVIGRLGYCLFSASVRSRRAVRTQLRGLRLVGQPLWDTGATVIPHALPAVYCLAKGSGTVVMTSAAVRALDAAQVEAVLAHERGHLRRKDHRLLMVSSALTTAFPILPVFRLAHEQLAQLVELRADDAAIRLHQRRDLARALVRLAEGTIPAPALGAGNIATVERLQRLTNPRPPVGRLARLTGLVAGAATAALPVVLAVAPAIAAAELGYCPVPFS
ncbi:MAG: M56 family metallopeptidase [Actinomycetota bacterium]|nr:M56 family metallopeptidase [Actinomycetota bacterium]